MPVRLQAEPFDVGHELACLTGGQKGEAGAAVVFAGYVRDRSGGRSVTEMVLEHYAALAQSELEHIENSARARWPITDLLIVHRYGALKVGEAIMCVIALAPHRRTAFEAAEYVMDVLKVDAPFWKQEKGPEGARWVGATLDDEAASRRWKV